MPAITIPPDAQIAPLLRGYDNAVAAKRRQMLLGLTIAILALVVAGVGAEVNLPTFWAKLGNFTSYFDRLMKLDSGARVWTDPTEWFWGLRRWSRLLGETLLMAYVGTLTGAIG